MHASRQRGLTLVEIMVSLAVLGVAAGLIFGVQMRMTGALRDQQNIAEVQQTLRSAAAVISKDIRQAGFLTVAVYEMGDPGIVVQPVQVTNGASGAPDVLRLQSANNTCEAHICDTNNTWCPGHTGPTGWKSGETEVNINNCFQDGQLAYAVRTITVGTPGTAGYIPAGTGCILMITQTPQTNVGGTNLKIQHHPQVPWNTAGNDQCSALATVWDDGYTMFMGISLRSYRINPCDQRGVLQMCNNGICDPACNSADWQDVALGIVDMQFALRVCHNSASDFDADLASSPQCTNIDWFSGDTMGTLAGVVTNPRIIDVSVTLVAKTTKEVNGPRLSDVPSLKDPSFPDDYNRLSDKGAVTLPVTSTSTWPSSMYVGDVIYRVFTTTIDLRNVGVGIDGHS